MNYGLSQYTRGSAPSHLAWWVVLEEEAAGHIYIEEVKGSLSIR